MSEWEAYNLIEPVGELRGDLRIAQLTSMVYNMASAFGGKTSRRHISKPGDFMHFFKDEFKTEEQDQSVDEMKATLMGVASSINEKMKRTSPKKLLPPKKEKKVV